MWRDLYKSDLPWMTLETTVERIYRLVIVDFYVDSRISCKHEFQVVFISRYRKVNGSLNEVKAVV